MVETIKCLPALSPTRFYRRASKEINLPMFLAGDPQPKRWIGRCPGDPPRPLKIPEEFDRHQPLTIGRSPTLRVKQQQPRRKKNRWKSIHVGAPVSSLSILSDVDSQHQSRLSHASSKSFARRKEPLRPVHQSTNNADEESSYRSPVLLTQESFLRLSSSCSPTRSFLPSISPFKEESHLDPPDSTCSFTVHSSCEHLPAMNQHRSSANPDLLLFTDGESTIARKTYKLPLPSHDEKPKESVAKKISRSKSVEKKSTLDPLESDKRDLGRGLSPGPIAVASIPKRQTLASVASAEQLHQSLRRKVPPLFTASIGRRSSPKVENIKWLEPYIGARHDPPTPPSSPSFLIFSPSDIETRFEQSSASETFV